MKLEVHTFDPELLNLLMERETVAEGDVLVLSEAARLVYERTFARKVKHFPLILYFSVEVGSYDGACQIVNWLFSKTDKRNLEKVVVEYQDVRMDAEQIKSLLFCKD